MCGCGTCLELIVLLVITQLFCKFSHGISMEWVHVQACGTILEKKQIFLLGNKWVCKVGLIEQPLATQPRQCNQAPKCPARNFIGYLEGIVYAQISIIGKPKRDYTH
jgi:hypothetical protein